jgi:hypothetical protein
MVVTRPRAIEVHIDELILHGFNPADRHQIGDAVQTELVRLLETKELAQSIRRGASIERLDGGEITPHGPGPRSLGRAIAQGVFGGLS